MQFKAINFAHFAIWSTELRYDAIISSCYAATPAGMIAIIVLGAVSGC
jgi:hypothetical protein